MAKRLSKADWIAHGLATLEAKGSRALRAESLARSLKVSRGSFYWHFDDILTFHRAILDSWRRRAALAVIEDVEAAVAGEADGAARLGVMMQRAFDAGGGLERAVRAWTAETPWVGAAVGQVDAARVAYLEHLLQTAGVSADLAATRARFIYSAYLGQLLIEPESGLAPGSGSIAAITSAMLRD